jgi:cell division protein FtsQ
VSSVAVPSDRHFRRAHVRPARKRERWRRPAARALKGGLVALLAAVAVYRGGEAVAQARVLQVGRIVVRGNHHLSSGEVLAVLDGLRGEHILWTDLDRWRERLLASPWVADAFLRRSLPSTVEVVVSEREPIAVGRLSDGLYLIDGRGAVIDQFGPQHADLDLPIVDGLAGARHSTSAPDEARAGLAARLILSFKAKPDVAHRVSQIDVTDPHNAGVILNGDSAVIYVGEDRFLPRVEAYLELAAALREQVTDIDYVDLRFDDRVYVRPAGKAAAAPPARPVVQGQAVGTRSHKARKR